MDTGGLKLNEGQYLSIAEPVDYECVITRSRFIASLRRATNRTEFERELQEITRLYPKATHHCWAYRFEAHPILEHSSDAGEPPGTAGRPMLGALKKYSLSNIMAVVTRYYGGVKLGVKGLISAYGGTLLMALEHAEIVEREPMSRLNFICTYDLYNILLSRLVKFQISQEMIKTEFAEHVSGEIQVPNSILTALTKELASISPGGRNLSYTLLPH